MCCQMRTQDSHRFQFGYLPARVPDEYYWLPLWAFVSGPPDSQA